MDANTRKRLAETMKIDPAQILDYRAVTADNYTVILTNYQKFTNVEPAQVKRRKTRRRGSVGEGEEENS